MNIAPGFIFLQFLCVRRHLVGAANLHNVHQRSTPPVSFSLVFEQGIEVTIGVYAYPESTLTRSLRLPIHCQKIELDAT